MNELTVSDPRQLESKPRPIGRRGEDGRAGIAFLLLCAFVLGIGVALLLFKRGAGERALSAEDRNAPRLSEFTSNVLTSLESPVEIRFYALLDPASVTVAVRDFAERVNELLSECARVSGGKLTVIGQLAFSEAAANAASADGIKPFNLDKGDPCFLGLVVCCGTRKELLPALAPEWEQALEPDVTRAILRVIDPRPTIPVATSSSAPDPVVIAEVRRLLPQLASLSLAEGAQILREQSVKNFGEATKESQLRLREAQQRLAETRNSGTEEQQQAALQEFRKVQAEQTEKLSQIAGQFEAQMAALEYLKKN